MPNMEVLELNSMHCNILAKAQKLDFRITPISTVLFRWHVSMTFYSFDAIVTDWIWNP